MEDSRAIVEKDNYLVYSDTGEKAVFYECDPEKNTKCDALMCRSRGGPGFCGKTTHPEFQKEGSRCWHAVKKTPDVGEPYWGREYMDE